MRLFVGIAITDEIRNNIAQYMQTLDKVLPNAAKWVQPESLHVTLKFIGQSDKVAQVQNELRAVASPPITMTFHGVGFFTPSKPRVFWAGVQAGTELEKLADVIDERLFRVGVPREPHTYQEYQPHVTLARSGSERPQGSGEEQNKSTTSRDKSTMSSLQNLVGKQPPPEFGTMTADEFILFRSETLPGGARYTPLMRFPMK